MGEGESSTGNLSKKVDGEIWLPTGSTLLDLVVGAGRGMGHEAGQLINLVSESQGGKTALCNEAIANGYHRFKDKFKWVYDATCEGGNTFDSQTLYGMDIIPKKAATKSRTIQEANGNIVEFLDSLEGDEFGIYVLDSIDAVTSDEIEDIAEGRNDAFKKGKKYDKGSYQGQKPKYLSSEFLPHIASLAEKKNCLIIIVSQLRDNVNAGLYAPKDRISNGRALLFYCSSRIWLKTKADIERAGKPIGVVVHAETRKARGPKPYRSCMYIFYYEYGIDDVGGNIDFLYDLRTPERGELSKTAAKNIYWDGSMYTREDLIGFIEANNLEEELKTRTIAKWNQQEEEASKETSERKKRF
jgi:RecA/RadA recombinase